jgi:D-alanyl-D-alanine carboxypeptidase (penicillin-binding protein 5/6)
MAMTNHNHLVGKVDGVDGLKTGFTNGAGFCLAATAARKGRRVIVVTMGSDQGKNRDLAVAELLEQGFAALAAAPVLPIETKDAPVAESIVKPAPRAAAAPPLVEEPPIKFSVPKR